MQTSKIAGASFLPGLQNMGTISAQASISGILHGSPNSVTNTSNTYGIITLTLPDPNLISSLLVNFPDAAGDLASKWFPLFGSGYFYDSTNNWVLNLYVGSSPTGRNIYYNFCNTVNFNYPFSSFRINIYGHLYTYPF